MTCPALPADLWRLIIEYSLDQPTDYVALALTCHSFARICKALTSTAMAKFVRLRTDFDMHPYGGLRRLYRTILPNGVQHGRELIFAPTWGNEPEVHKVEGRFFSMGLKDGQEIFLLEDGRVHNFNTWRRGVLHGPQISTEKIQHVNLPDQWVITRIHYIDGVYHGRMSTWMECSDRTQLLPTQTRTKWYWHGVRCHQREFELQLRLRGQEEKTGIAA